MNDFTDQLLSNRAYFLVLFTFGLFLAMLANRKVRFLLMDFWTRFPVIGGIARLSKDTGESNNGWRHSEEKLCGQYKKYVDMIGQRTFDNNIEYLRLSGDLGRQPVPAYAYGLLFILLVMEALGFSFLLAKWTAEGGSTNVQTTVAYAIVMVLAIILAIIMERAGHQFFRTSILRNCFTTFKSSRNTRGNEEYFSRTMSLSNAQDLDENEQEHVRTVNRIANGKQDKGSYGWGMVAIAAIIIIAAGSVYMRYEALNGEQIRETTGQNQAGGTSPFGNGDPFATLGETPMPLAESESQTSADVQAERDAQDSRKGEGLAAFAILGFIFVATQIVGMGIGYRYGFAGRESKAAYNMVHGCSTYDQYLSVVRPIVDIASGRLKDLQQRMEERLGTRLGSKKTFHDFLAEKKRGETRSMQNDERESPAPNIQKQGKPTHSGARGLTVRDVIEQMNELNNVDDEKDLYKTLPAELKQNPDLVTWLVERKKEREKAKTNPNIEELF